MRELSLGNGNGTSPARLKTVAPMGNNSSLKSPQPITGERKWSISSENDNWGFVSIIVNTTNSVPNGNWHVFAQVNKLLLRCDARFQGVISPYESVDVNRTDDNLSGLSIRRVSMTSIYETDKWTVSGSAYIRSEAATRDNTIYYDKERRRKLKNDQFVLRAGDLFASYNISNGATIMGGYFRPPLYNDRIWSTRVRRNFAILNLSDRRSSLEGALSITKSITTRLNVGILPRFVKDREGDKEGLKSRYFNNVGSLPNSLYATLENTGQKHTWRLGGFVNRIGNRLTFNPTMNEKGYLVGLFADYSRTLLSKDRDTVTISNGVVYGGISGQDLNYLINRDNKFLFCSLSAEHIRVLRNRRLGLRGLGFSLGFSYASPDLRRFEDYWDDEANRNIDADEIVDGVFAANFHFSSSAKVALSYEVSFFSMKQQVHVARLLLSFQFDNNQKQ